MNCPKHPDRKMTLLFTTWVCDVCDPPDTDRAELEMQARQFQKKFFFGGPFPPAGTTLKRKSPPEADADGYVLCPKCGTKAVMAVSKVRTNTINFSAECVLGHYWIPNWKKGHKTKNTLIGSPFDFEYDPDDVLFWKRV